MSAQPHPSAPDHVRLAGFQMVLCTFLWGGFFVAGKLAVADASPLVAAALRFLTASVVLVALLALREPAALRLRTRRDWLLAAALGATGVAGYNILAFLAFPHAPASDGAMISPSLNPVVTAIGAALLFHEPLKRAKVAGLALAIAGIALVFGGPLLAAAATPMRLVADTLFLASALTWSAYTLLGKIAVTRFSGLASTTYASVFGFLMLLPFSWEGLSQLNWGALPLRFWAAIAFLALFCTVAAFLLWYAALKHIGPSRTASYLPLVPIFGVLQGMLLLGDRPTWIQFAGMALAIAGVWLANRTAVPRGGRSLDSAAATAEAAAPLGGAGEVTRGGNSPTRA